MNTCLFFLLMTAATALLVLGANLWAQTQTKIDALVVALVKREHEKAVKLLTDHRAKLDELSKYLYEKETITGEEFMKILNLEKAQDKTQD